MSTCSPQPATDKNFTQTYMDMRKLLIITVSNQGVAQPSPKHQMRDHDTNRQWFHADCMAGPIQTDGAPPCLLALGV